MSNLIRRPAGFWIRLGANILDFLIVILPLSLLFRSLIGWDGFFFKEILPWAYYILIPILWYGYTVGKRFCGIRVVKINGDDVTLRTMLIREVLGAIIYSITFGIAAIVSAFMVGLREDKRSIHDLIAGTYVTYSLPESL